MEMPISQHELRRPQRPLSPDQFVPLANATNIFSNITTNNSTSLETYETTSASGQALCFGWLLLVLLCICRPNVPDARYRLYPENRERRRASIVEDPEAREERIEQSLSVKRVVTADGEGGLTLGEPLITEMDSNTGDDTSASSHSMEDNEETSTCIICLEPFRVGDIVAWSKQSTIPRDKADVEAQPCLHVFHRDCIASWLTNPKHDDCPACRSIILQDSPDESGQEDPEESSLEDEDLEAPSMMPFVIMHGLVSRVRHASYSLIGQSVDVSAADYAEDDDDDRLSCVPQPSQLQRVFSLGERRPSISKSERLRRGSTTSAGSQRDERRTPPPPVSLAESLNKPIALRRVVSADPGSPARSIHHNEGPPLTDADDGAVFRRSLSPALQRTSSGIHARLSLSEDSTEEDLQIVRSSVSRRDVDQSTSDQ
jgi:hypothetical protein